MNQIQTQGCDCFLCCTFFQMHITQITKSNTINIDINFKLQNFSQLLILTMDFQNDAIIPQSNQAEETVKKIQHYLFKWSDLIGQGSFSQVYLGINQKNQEQVAIKMIKNQSVKSKTAQRLLNHQINILKYLDHPNVIKSHDVFSSLNNCYIITEYCEGGDIEKTLRQKRFFQEQQITKIVYDVYKGLQYLNDNFIIHRDLKLANIFLRDGNYKVADFGFAIRSKSIFADIPVGSPIYMSPQGLINNNYGPKTDVWSFGVMIYQLLHGEAPLDRCRTQQELKVNIMRKPQIKTKLSKQIKQLIERCMQVNVLKRISISEIKDLACLKNILALYEVRKVIPQKLTSTYHSTEASSQVFESLFDTNFSYEQALSILHYCRLLHKSSLKTSSKQFSLWLLLIFQGFSKCKIVRSTQSPKSQNPKTKYQNLKQVIQQYHQKYKNQHAVYKTISTLLPSFGSVLTQCTKLHKQYETKNILPELKTVVFNLYKQTQLLNQSFKTNKMCYFAKHSQSREFLSILGKVSPL